MPGRLAGRIAIITGAARGQGEAEARRFVAEGARVIVADVLEEEARVVAKDLGDSAVQVTLDVRFPEHWQAALAASQQAFGDVPDLLVNNAAVTLYVPLEQCTLDQIELTHDVNILGVLLGMQAVFPGMRDKGKGAIVNISSAAALAGSLNMAVYTGTKAAVLGITRVASGEWGPLGIRTNAILPGAVDTPMMRGPHTTSVDVDALCASVPIPRAGRPEELAAAVAFLCSDEASYVNGVALPVDGGRSASWAPSGKNT